MFIEHVISATESRKAGIAVFRAVETVLRAFAVTDIDKLAGEAFGREAITLFKTEAVLLIRGRHLT